MTRKLSFQQLERRDVMAGNVLASMTADGSLHLKGDNAANNVWVIESGPHTFAVIGQSGTKINDRSQVTFNSVTRNIDIALAGGDDAVTVAGDGTRGVMSCRNIDIDMGAGKTSQDVLLTTRDFTPGFGPAFGLLVGGNVTVEGEDFSSLHVVNTHVMGDFKFTGSFGSHLPGFLMTHSTVDKNVLLDLRQDHTPSGLGIYFDHSFGAQIPGQFGALKTVGGTLSIRGSDQSETLSLDAVDIAIADIELLGGSDVLQIITTSRVGRGVISGGQGHNHAIYSWMKPQLLGNSQLQNFTM